ncbi:hypothetical protein GIB67_006313 [Kingdonia uniflora]|uniref:Uncharacterized protein n=1 Tax=Kingdonia uniflora TaxID=39325 RepID=A0A7J7P5F9_9MAGN|nr:hypothetical protein GIB67_006313 [Kingdonia uniflora]
MKHFNQKSDHVVLQVEKIPETFSSVDHYMKSFNPSLFAETHAELFSSIDALSQAPTCKIIQMSDISKGSKSSKAFIYKITIKQNKYSYKPQNGDVIAFSSVRPRCVSDLNRPQRPFTLAVVSKRGRSVTISSSNPITDAKGKKKIGGPLFAVFLINIITNSRISMALTNDTNKMNINVIKEVLHSDSTVGFNCNLCQQEADCIFGKDTLADLRSFNLNESQNDAVLSTVLTSKCNHKSSVKLVWGPPGTGKTKTVATCLWALLVLKKRTLTCAPTNTAVVQVALRLLKLVRETLCKDSFKLGDIVLFGNGSRMNIADHGDLCDIFLDNRVDSLVKCFSPISGLKPLLNTMIHFLENHFYQYILYLERARLHMFANKNGCSPKKNKEERRTNLGKGENHEEVNSQNETQLIYKKTIDILTFRKSVIQEFSRNKKCLVSSIRSLCTHLPSSFIPVYVKEIVDEVLGSLESLGAVLTAVTSEEEFRKTSINLKQSSYASSGSSTLLLRNGRNNCLRALNLLQVKFVLPKFSRKNKIEKMCLQHACLIFCTISSSAKLHSKGMIPFGLLVIDEAAQLKECETLIPLQLPGIQHAVLIGDERQLPATVISKISEEAEFGRSMFERLVSLGHKKHLLNVQYRMHPSISLFPNTEFYNKQISDAPNVNESTYKRQILQGNMFGPLSFINVANGKEVYDNKHSLKNMVEIVVVAEIVENLYQASVATRIKISVGIISPYKAQVSALITKFGPIYENCSDFSLSIRSVDGFQGSEEDVIIISTVRSNWNGSVGFLSNSQRTNVALTRARYCLWILGNEQTLINSGSVWKKLVIDTKDRGCFFNANDDKGLSKTIINSVIELDQLDDLLNGDLLFKGARWKVTFGDGFKKSLERIKEVHIRREVVDLMMKLSNGWRYPQKRKNLNTGDGLLKQYKIHGVLMLFWIVDILKEGSKCVQVLKFWDISPSSGAQKLARQFDYIFGNYTLSTINRCKYKCIEGYVSNYH